MWGRLAGWAGLVGVTVGLLSCGGNGETAALATRAAVQGTVAAAESTLAALHLQRTAEAQSASAAATATVVARHVQAAQHVDAARGWRDAEQFGLAIEEARQALGVWPDSADARAFLEEVAPEATRQVEEARAVRAAATRDARAAAARATTGAVAAATQEARAVLDGVTAYLEWSRPRVIAMTNSINDYDRVARRAVVRNSLLFDRAWRAEAEAHAAIARVKQAGLAAQGYRQPPAEVRRLNDLIVAAGRELVAAADGTVAVIDHLHAESARYVVARVDAVTKYAEAASEELADMRRRFEAH